MKKIIIIRYIGLFGIALILLNLISCNKAPKNTPKLDVYCDEAVYNLMKEPMTLYDSAYTDKKANFIKVSAAEAMSKLLAGEAPVSIISRDYSPREDSLMKEHGVPARYRKPLAQDALVLFTANKYPLDTIDDIQIKNIFTKGVKLSKVYPKVESEPNFVVSNKFSSEYENLKHFITGYKQTTCNIINLQNTDSVISYIKKHPADIGIGYLSQVVKDFDIKCLMIGFVDTSGEYIHPKVVHQANIIQNYYPYIINHWIYMFNEDYYLGKQLVNFLRAPQGKVQPYFLKAGIVPAVGDFNLIEQ
jgi:hypothetical protein